MSLRTVASAPLYCKKEGERGCDAGICTKDALSPSPSQLYYTIDFNYKTPYISKSKASDHPLQSIVYYLQGVEPPVRMPWACPYTAFYNWNLTGITVVIATVIGIFSAKANVPPFLPQPPFYSTGGALATVRIDVLIYKCHRHCDAFLHCRKQ